MNLRAVAERVATGATVICRPVGNSMKPIINSGQEVEIAPVRPEAVEVDDVVLAKVAGNVYLHKVLAIDAPRRRAQIGNNRGGVNGWTGFDRVYGICTHVAGVTRPHTEGKVTRSSLDR